MANKWHGAAELEKMCRPLDEFKLDPNNARKHDTKNVQAIKASLSKFGQQKPIVALANGTVIAGNGTLQAAKALGWDRLAVVLFTSKKDAAAYALADNRTSELATWDEAMLQKTLKTLQEQKFDIGSIGFDVEAMFGSNKEAAAKYSSKIDTPIYTPKGTKPTIASLADRSQTMKLFAQIKDAKVTEDERAFLYLAAQRHTVFDYHSIAEYYAHATPEMQELMEQSALVIIDFKKAVEQGYVVLTRELEAIYDQAHGVKNGEA